MIPSAINFRPLAEGAGGPWPGAHRVFRTGSMVDLTPEDARLLAGSLGLRRFFDLRTEPEVQQRGVSQALVDAGVEWIHVPISGGAALIGAAEPTPRAYAALWIAMLDDGRASIRRLFEHLADATGYPVAYGCYLGKDRTGLVSTLLLAALGFEREVVVADYLETGRHLPRSAERFARSWRKRGLSRAAYLRRIEPRAELLDAALAAVRERFGGPLDYLAEIGVSPTVLAEVRRAIVTHTP